MAEGESSGTGMRAHSRSCVLVGLNACGARHHTRSTPLPHQWWPSLRTLTCSSHQAAGAARRGLPPQLARGNDAAPVSIHNRLHGSLESANCVCHTACAGVVDAGATQGDWPASCAGPKNSPAAPQACKPPIMHMQSTPQVCCQLPARVRITRHATGHATPPAARHTISPPLRPARPVPGQPLLLPPLLPLLLAPPPRLLPLRAGRLLRWHPPPCRLPAPRPPLPRRGRPPCPLPRRRAARPCRRRLQRPRSESGMRTPRAGAALLVRCTAASPATRHPSQHATPHPTLHQRGRAAPCRRRPRPPTHLAPPPSCPRQVRGGPWRPGSPRAAARGRCSWSAAPRTRPGHPPGPLPAGPWRSGPCPAQAPGVQDAPRGNR